MGKEIEVVLWGIFHISSLIISWQDIQTRMIHRYLLFLALFPLIILAYTYPIYDHSILGIIIFILAIVVTSFYKKQKIIAPADVFYGMACLLFVDPFYYFIFIGGISLLFYKIKKETLPFISILYGAFVLLYSLHIILRN